MSGHSYKGSAVRPNRTLSLVGPTMQVDLTDNVTFQWNLANPPFWSLQVLSAGVWGEVDNDTGTVRVFNGDLNTLDVASVIGVDAHGNQITGRSNVVIAP